MSPTSNNQKSNVASVSRPIVGTVDVADLPCWPLHRSREGIQTLMIVFRCYFFEKPNNHIMLMECYVSSGEI